MSCGAPEQGGALGAAAVGGQTVIQGQVVQAGSPVPRAFVRLLDAGGEFTAEVESSPGGDFRFFAAPGSWTLRTLAPKAEPVDRQVVAQYGEVAEVAVAV
jgi:hypothetical protein